MMGKKCSFACLLVLFLVQVNCDEALEELEDIANESEFQGIPSKNILAKYDGAQLLRIPNVEQLDKNAVTELQTKYEAAMWSLQSESVDMFLKKSLVDKAKSFLKSSNVNFDVIIADVQNAIDSENPPKDQLELWQNRNGHLMTWTAYHRLSDVHGYLEYLANTYPDLCSVQTIGQSLQGKALRVLRISNGNAKNKAVWVDGGIHAREWISPATVTYIIDQLTENWEDQPNEIKSIDWHFLPVMNPDGYEFTHTNDRLWRKNRRVSGPFCAGVDLNRNFGHHWGGQGSSRQPCSEIFAGSGAFSEPETKAVKDFLEKSAGNFKASLSFHSYGQYILYPWGYDKLVPADVADLDRVGKQAAEKMKRVGGATYSVGSSGKLLYPAAGGSDDWYKGVMNIKYAYTVELRDSGRHGFILPASQIIQTGQETMELFKVIAKAVSHE